jgi:CheY-like chemotaxis protein
MLRAYDTSVESDPRRALARMYAGELFEVVLCDLKMPHRSGLEVLDEIRAYYADRAGMPHIIMMSGSDELSEEDLATPVLPKPCSATEVRAMVTRLLETPTT